MEREQLLREIEAIDRARERRSETARVRAERLALRRGRNPARSTRRRTVSVLGAFALVAAVGIGVLVFKPTVASDLAGVASGASRLRWQRIGSSIYPVRRIVVVDNGVVGVSSPGIIVESDPMLEQWRVVPVETRLEVEPAARAELGPVYRAETVGRVGDVLSGIAVARGGRVVVVGGFLGEGGTRDSSTLYYDPGAALWNRPVTLEADFLHACAFDELRGYAVGNLGNIVFSSTAGSRWDFTPVVTNADLFDVRLISEDGRAVVVGGACEGPEPFGVVLVSGAWGAPFRGVFRTARPLRAIAYAKGGEVILTGDGGTVCASEDGGLSWKDLSNDVPFAGTFRPDLLAAAIARDGGQTMAAAGGGDGTVIYSNDGKTWSESPLPAGAGTVTALLFHSGALYALTDRSDVYRAAVGREGN